MLASTEFVRAGNWVFGTGLRGAASPELFRRMEAGLEAAGSSMSRVARVDQYYPDLSCVAPYQAARKKAFERRQVAPSTSVLVSKLRDPASQVDVQVMAATSASGYVPTEVHTGLNRPDSSGYAPCLRVGDLIFVAGQLARDASGQLAAHGVKAGNRISRAASPSSGLAGGALRARSRVEGAGLCQPAGGHSRVLGGVEKRFRQAPAADDRSAGAPSCIPDQRRHGRR